MKGGTRFKRPRRVLAVAGCALFATAGAAYGTHLAIDTEGHTTLEQILQGTGANFKTLSIQAVNDDYIVRAPDPQAQPQAGRETRRTSLAYFSQLTDFQLADEESPARVEFVDPQANSAHRPQEAFHPFLIDAAIRQINRFATSSPVPQGNGLGNTMDFSLLTGDQADNMQRNEMVWTRALIEGINSDFGSGVEDPAYYNPATNPQITTKPSCPAYIAQEGGFNQAAAEAVGYTGVQDYDDYPAAMPGPNPAYYDPDQPVGQYATWPQWTGLMDRAQTLSFTPAGLDVPSYWSNGNHDVLVQGNEDANAAFEDIATACFKALGTTVQIPPSGPGPDFSPDPNLLLNPTSAGMLVPPDPDRRFVDRPQVKAIVGANNVDDDHGFDFVENAQNAASNGNASYYAWDPPQTPGFRFINIDTNSEGGQTAEGVASGSANGNIDDPQFHWLEDQLDAAQDADKIIVIFGHHPVRSMTTEIADENASPCTTNDTHANPPFTPADNPEHDVNPGCDRDPRVSEPLHLGPEESNAGGQSFVDLLSNYPNVIAYVAGHTHEHKLLPCGLAGGCGSNPVWWEINTSATADWPPQERLVDIMDNKDGTLSLFGTVLDAAAPSGVPGAGPAGGFDVNQLGSIGRTLNFNDPQVGPPGGEGLPQDRNVEMLVADPRDVNLAVVKTDSPDPVNVGSPLTYTLHVTNSGPSSATATTVTDNLPPTVNFGSAIPTQGTCAAPVGDQLTCAIGDVPVGGSVDVMVTVTPQTSGTITNRSSVASVLNDINPANNSENEQTTVNALPGNADLSLTKTGPATVMLGQPLSYGLSVRNNGPDPAIGVAITDPLPSGTSFVSATATQGTCSQAFAVVTCEIGALPNGAVANAQIVVNPLAAGTFVNSASVASGIADGTPGNNSAQATSTVTAPPSGTGGGTSGGAQTPTAQPTTKAKCKKRAKRKAKKSEASAAKKKKRCKARRKRKR